MQTLRRQVRRARRRLIVQSFIGKLSWCWFVTLLLAALAIAAGKYWPPADPRAWELGSLAAALAAGALAAAIWTRLARASAFDAAVEIDRRFGLKERVSSSLALDAERLQSAAGRALVEDTAGRLATIDVRERFGVRPDRRALLPLAPAAVAIGLALFVDGRGPLAPTVAAATQSAQIKKATQALAKKIDEGRKQAQDLGLVDADALWKQLEQGIKGLADKTRPDRKQTLVALNELAKEAEKRRQQLVDGAALWQQLNQLKNLQRGPAEKLGHALKNGDLKKAIAELEKLKVELAADKLDAKGKEQLAGQLDQMQQALSKMASAHEQARHELKEQIEAHRRAGNLPQADKQQQHLDKLAQKSPQMAKLHQMAQQLQQASQCTRQGQCDEAAQVLDRLAQSLGDLEKESEELAMLDNALDQIADAKNAMACKACNGEGCKECQGKDGDPPPVNRFAKGRGRGAGQREEKKNDTGFYDSQVKQDVGKGASLVTGLADGPNRKGQIQAEISGQFSAAPQDSEEVLSGQRLPHDYRDHAKKYFDALREGQR